MVRAITVSTVATIKVYGHYNSDARITVRLISVTSYHRHLRYLQVSVTTESVGSRTNDSKGIELICRQRDGASSRYSSGGQYLNTCDSADDESSAVYIALLEDIYDTLLHTKVIVAALEFVS